MAHHTSVEGGQRWGIQHSLLQQVLACHPLAYLINVALRPGHPVEMIRYPEPIIDISDSMAAPAQPDMLHVPMGLNNVRMR
jgi:hypothetical protein